MVLIRPSTQEKWHGLHPDRQATKMQPQ